MHSRRQILLLLSSLTLATGAIALALPVPSTSLSTTPNTRRGTVSDDDDEQQQAFSSSPTCLLVDFPQTPIDPPACWSWFASTPTPSTYCGAAAARTFSSLPLSPTSTPTSQFSSCVEALAASSSSSSSGGSRDFFLAAYSPDVFNTLLLLFHDVLLLPGNSTGTGTGTGVGCALQVRPARPPSDEQIYVGGADVADILGLAAGSSSSSSNGIEGSMVCGEDEVSWRVVPVDS
ncbi:hypothetical protein F4809DRAFT_610510 [Biscogniauxia mediterranea]|nr:hypothetical protein F4809DRAFT_610510 [Biscogniauxia mediterranea]